MKGDGSRRSRSWGRFRRMAGHGHTSSANDETYTWNCCNQLSGYTDAFGTAVLTYDVRPCVPYKGRMLTHTDSLGNDVQYEYDMMSRVTKLTPAQGTSYRTEYAFNANGSIVTVAATLLSPISPADKAAATRHRGGHNVHP